MKLVMIIAFMSSLTLVDPSAIGSSLEARIYLKENARIGTRVADSIQLMGLPSSTVGFKLLSQKVVQPKRNPLGLLVRRKWMRLNKKSGLVTLIHRVDREEMCGDFDTCVILLEIFATASRRLLNLKVYIEDVNDNSPQFPTNQIKVEVPESAQVNDVINLSEFMAHDADQGNNSFISYSILSNPYFSLEEIDDNTNTAQLLLKVKQKLDHETDPVQKLTLIARDHGTSPRTSHAEVVVQITDVNDNDPEFYKQDYFVTLPENLQSGRKIIRVQASDADFRGSRTLRYSVSRRNKNIARSLIEVDSVTGDVTLKQTLDRELHDKLRILIEARDSNLTNQRVGRTWLQINVEDVNDNAPQIEVKFILTFDRSTVYLPEDAPVGTYIAYLTVKDPDFGENGKVNVSIESVTPKTGQIKLRRQEQNVFNITDTGFICLHKMIDREKISSFLMVIKACDRGSPSQCSRKQITIELLDVNDHRPMFNLPTVNLELSEDTKVGSIVTTVRATDDDTFNLPALYEDKQGKIMTSPYGKIFYHIIDGDGSLSINSQTGEVTLERPLDREVIDRFSVTVRAKDGGRQSALQSVCKIYVTVTDVNDNTPSFTNDNVTYYSTILQNDVILNIQALDYDAEENGTVSYRILSADGRDTSEASSLFLLDPISGEMKLNFSNINLNTSLGLHRIEIEASDKGAISRKNSRFFSVMVTDWEELPLAEDIVGFKITSPLGLTIMGSSLLLFILSITGIVVVSKKCKNKNRKTSFPLSDGIARNSFIEKTVQRKLIEDDIDEAITSDRIYLGVNRSEEVFSTDHHTDDFHTHSTNRYLANDKHKTSKRSQQSSANEKQEIQQHHIAVPPAPSNDADSGRGDSDPDGPSTSDILFDRGPHLNMENRLVGGGYRCTKQCLVLGHSDYCWMHLPYPDSNRNQPLSNKTDVNSSLYVELNPLPTTSHYPGHITYAPLNHHMVSQPSYNYPANELSAIYSDIIVGDQRHDKNLDQLRRVTPISVLQEDESLRFSPTSCLSTPPSFKPHYNPALNRPHFHQGSLRRNQEFLREFSSKDKCSLMRSASADLIDNDALSYQERTLPRKQNNKGLSSAKYLNENIVGNTGELL